MNEIIKIKTLINTIFLRDVEFKTVFFQKLEELTDNKNLDLVVDLLLFVQRNKEAERNSLISAINGEMRKMGVDIKD